MLTGDENIVDLAFTVQYRITDATKYLFNIKDPDEMVKAIAESSMREVIGKTPLKYHPDQRPRPVQNETADLMQHILDNYNSGITVVEVQIIAQPIRPRSDSRLPGRRQRWPVRQLRRQRSQAYSNKVVNEAKGDASKITQSAEGYRAQVVLEAEGDAARFNQVYDQYRHAPAVTRQRLYLETMERVLAKSNKVIVDAHGATARSSCRPTCPARSPAAARPERQPPPAQPAGCAVDRARAAGRQPGGRPCPSPELANGPPADHLPPWPPCSSAGAIANSFFVVDQRERAIVLRFGQAVRVINAAVDDDPGLKVKVPFAEIFVLLDKRNQALDAGQEEVIAADQRGWWSTVSSAIASSIRCSLPRGGRRGDRARPHGPAGQRLPAPGARLGQLHRHHFRQALGPMAQARDEVAAEAVASRLGMQIIDLRIKRADLPDTIRRRCSGAMKTARQQEAAQITRRGRTAESGNQADADRRWRSPWPPPTNRPQTLRGEGDAKRAALFAKSFGRDPSSPPSTASCRPTRPRSARATRPWCCRRTAPSSSISGRGRDADGTSPNALSSGDEQGRNAVQAVGDQHALVVHLVGRLQQVRHHHRHHAGGVGGAHAVVGSLPAPNSAKGRRQAEARP